MARGSRQERERRNRQARRRAERQRERLRCVGEVTPPTGPDRELTPDVDLQKQLEDAFTGLGIDYSRPGFFDHPAFIQAEKKDNRFLEKYALYVQKRQYTDSYLAQAEERTRAAAHFLHETLKKDGRLGACIDASLTVSRFLEKEGVWNCILHGATAVHVPGLPPRFYWPIRHPNNPAKTGHMWICAPPFRVVDITISLQPYPPQYLPHLPDIVLARQTTETSFALDELVEMEARVGFHRFCGRPYSVHDVEPAMFEVARQFGAFWTATAGTRFKYIPTAVTAPDGRLEDIKGFCPSVPNPADLYANYIKQLPDRLERPGLAGGS